MRSFRQGPAVWHSYPLTDAECGAFGKVQRFGTCIYPTDTECKAFGEVRRLALTLSRADTECGAFGKIQRFGTYIYPTDTECKAFGEVRRLALAITPPIPNAKHPAQTTNH